MKSASDQRLGLVSLRLCEVFNSPTGGNSLHVPTHVLNDFCQVVVTAVSNDEMVVDGNDDRNDDRNNVERCFF